MLDPQYKRVQIQGIKRLLAGHHEAAVGFFNDYLEARPNDLEGLYGLAAAYCGLGKLDQALAAAKQAIEAGLPAGRFLAGPRPLFEALLAMPQFQELVRQPGWELVHGPMPGCVTDTSARFWGRTAAAAEMQVIVGITEELKDPIRSPVARTSDESDFTAVLEVTGLEPDTLYHYEVLVDGEPTLSVGRPAFRTFPPRGGKAKFVVAFGGGAGYVPPNERVWDTVASYRPLAFLFLGDNVYHDSPGTPGIQRYCYYRRQSRPEFRRFAASTASYAVWDDHDFGTNDCIPGPAVAEPPWKIPVWRIFRENWNNPAYGGGEAQPGCWFDFSIGDVDFFMTDSRYYRSNPKKPHPSMLGPAQKQWLLARLKASRATFKVLANGVPWAFGTKPGSLDTWEGFPEEREEILSFIEQHRIDGVVLLSADRHRSDLWKLDREVGYPLYEFESSRLTNQHVHKQMPKALFSYNKKQSFGLLRVDTTQPDPEVAYEIITIDNEVVHTFTLKKSQLTPKP